MAFCGVMAFTFLGNGCSRHLLISSEVLQENLIAENERAWGPVEEKGGHCPWFFSYSLIPLKKYSIIATIIILCSCGSNFRVPKARKLLS